MGLDPPRDEAFRWRWVGDFVVQMFSEGEVDKTAWSTFIADLHGSRARVRGVLTLTHGGGPDAPQRSALRTVLDDGPPLPAAILTDSRMARVCVAALNLFLKPEARPRLFAPHRLDDAFEYLRMSPSLRPECRTAISEMERELGIERRVSA